MDDQRRTTSARSWPRQTLADIMVIGISPALIMALVGSLVFFLLTVFYHGQYQTRLTFIFALFVMAIVLVARISMEEGIEYASLFAIPLAVVTVLAMIKFVRIEGPLAGISLLINCGLIAVVWWCAHKLTWDCTLIDDREDASGEGLLQNIGFDAETVEDQARGSQAEPQQVEAGADGQQEQILDWWQRFVGRRRRAHTPGVWVVYFSLAALPLFGIGQWFIPAADLASRRFAFLLLCVYVASALGLLLTTSFLGLRRYLRQRRLQMPLDMAGLWLGIGAVMIVLLLVVCILLPRPGAVTSISQLPFQFGSPDQSRTSDWALGDDGPEQPQAARTRPAAKTASQDSAEAGEKEKPPPGSASNRSSAGESPSEAERPDGQNGGRKSSDESSRPQDQGRSKEGEPGASAEQNERRGRQRGDEAQKRPARGDQDDSAQNSPAPEQTKSGESGGQMQGRSGRDQQQRPAANSDRSEQPQGHESAKQSGGWLGKLGALLKLLLLVALLCAVGFFAWKYRVQIRKAIQQLVEDLKQLWARLFGRGKSTDRQSDVSADDELGQPARSFASYRDPFTGGAARGYTTEQLVCYSFEALEAWARERRCGRQEEQTPIEFGRHVARCCPSVAGEVQVLADLYSQVIYGRLKISPRRQDDLQRLWQQLRAAAPAAL